MKKSSFCKHLPKNEENNITKKNVSITETKRRRKPFSTSKDKDEKEGEKSSSSESSNSPTNNGNSKPRKKKTGFVVNPTSFISNVSKTKQDIERNGRGKERKKKTERIDPSTCDIVHIDATIRENFDIQREEILPLLNKKLEDLYWILENGEEDKLRASEEIRKVRQKIQDIESTSDLGVYTIRTCDILEEYRLIKSRRTKKSFVATKEKEDYSAILKKMNLIIRYLSIAQDYIDLDSVTPTIRKMRCDICGGTEFEQTSDGFICLGEGCGAVSVLVEENFGYKDTERVNMTTRFKYTKKGHLIDAMKKYQGKENITIPESVYETIYEQMKLHNDSKDKLTKDRLYMYMSENDLSDYYEHMNMIYHVITGKKPPNIEKYESQVLDYYDRMEEAYKEVKDPDRINNLNVNFILFKLLQLCGCKCKKEDFYSLRTPGKVDEHVYVFEDIRNILGWAPYPNR